jgi:hypothetical protein
LPRGRDKDDPRAEGVLRDDLVDALRTTSAIHATYLDALHDAVLSYVAALRYRGITRAGAQSELSRLVLEATDDDTSALLLHVGRWVDAAYAGP